MYSLACVVYEMLAGRHAFSGANTQQVVSRRFREPPPPLHELAREVPPSVARVIETAMSLDPARRPGSAPDFAKELAGAAASVSDLRLAVGRAARRARRAVLPQARRDRHRGRLGVLRQDLVHAFRQRRRSPGLTFVSLLTLAMGIGLTTAVSAIVDGVLLRPLPFPEPARLVALESVDSAGRPITNVSSANWTDWALQNRTLQGSALYMEGRATVGVDEHALRAQYALVTPGFFAVIGSRFRSGAGFDSALVRQGAGGAVVSEGLWRRELGASSDPGLAVAVNGDLMPVVGIVAAGQEYPAGTEVWTAFMPRPGGGAVRNNINWMAVARLEPEISLEAAGSDLSVIAAPHSPGRSGRPLFLRRERHSRFGSSWSATRPLCLPCLVRAVGRAADRLRESRQHQSGAGDLPAPGNGGSLARSARAGADWSGKCWWSMSGSP